MKKELVPGLAWAGAIIALALAVSTARNLGYLDQEIVERIVIGINGLMIVYFGNRLPKSVVPSAAARRVNRVAGWSMVLSGLLYAGLWAFAPVSVALWVGCGAVATGILVTLAYCVSQRGKMPA